MATGFDIFGETIRDWLEEPDNDEAEPVSLLLAASDDYETPPNSQVAGHSHSRFAPTKERWQRMAKRALEKWRQASISSERRELLLPLSTSESSLISLSKLKRWSTRAHARELESGGL